MRDESGARRDGTRARRHVVAPAFFLVCGNLTLRAPILTIEAALSVEFYIRTEREIARRRKATCSSEMQLCLLALASFKKCNHLPGGRKARSLQNNLSREGNSGSFTNKSTLLDQNVVCPIGKTQSNEAIVSENAIHEIDESIIRIETNVTVLKSRSADKKSQLGLVPVECGLESREEAPNEGDGPICRNRLGSEIGTRNEPRVFIVQRRRRSRARLSVVEDRVVDGGVNRGPSQKDCTARPRINEILELETNDHRNSPCGPWHSKEAGTATVLCYKALSVKGPEVLFHYAEILHRDNIHKLNVEERHHRVRKFCRCNGGGLRKILEKNIRQIELSRILNRDRRGSGLGETNEFGSRDRDPPIASQG